MTFMAHPHGKSPVSQLIAIYIDRLFTQRPPRRRYLDARDLPNHLKRDLGFLDGRDPPGTSR